MEARLTVYSLDDTAKNVLAFALSAGRVHRTATKFAVSPDSEGTAVECVLGRVLEIRVSLTALGIAAGAGLRFQLSLWRNGLPLDAVPQQGWLVMRTTNPAEMAR